MTQVVTSTVPGLETITETVDDNGVEISASIDGGPGGRNIAGGEQGQQYGSAISGTYFHEDFGPNWQLTDAVQLIVNNDGEQTAATTIDYGPSWNMTSASVIILPDPTGPSDPRFGDSTVETFDAGWQLTAVKSQIVVGNGGYLQTTYTYDANGNSTGGSANWAIDGVAGADTWTVGTHQLTVSTGAPDRLVDVAFDASGQMTGAKIFSYGIQGQAFTQTEEDYDASWHLTSWHGQGPGYDQTVNYMV